MVGVNDHLFVVGLKLKSPYLTNKEFPPKSSAKPFLTSFSGEAVTLVFIKILVVRQQQNSARIGLADFSYGQNSLAVL